jgi:hypothetical protein
VLWRLQKSMATFRVVEKFAIDTSTFEAVVVEIGLVRRTSFVSISNEEHRRSFDVGDLAYR